MGLLRNRNVVPVLTIAPFSAERWQAAIVDRSRRRLFRGGAARIARHRSSPRQEWPLAVQRAVEAIQGVGQRYEAGRHVGQGIGLLTSPGVQGLAGRLGIVGQAGAAQLVEQAAAARAVGCGADHRRQLAGAPPEAEAEQGGQASTAVASCQSVGSRRSPSGSAAAGGSASPCGAAATSRVRGGRLVRSRPSRVFHQTTSSAGNSMRPAFGHQRLAFLATADEALVGLVGQLRWSQRRRPCTSGSGNGGKLGAGKPLDLQQHIARSRRPAPAPAAGSSSLMLSARAGIQARRPDSRQVWAGPAAGCSAKSPHLPAGARAEGVVVVAATVDQGRAEGLRRNLQGAALLRKIAAHLDHAVADAVDLS